MHLTGIQLFLWLASTLGNIALLVVMISRHRLRELPIFSTLIALNIVRTLALFSIYRAGMFKAYWFIYWGLAALDLLLQFAVVYELAAAVFRPAGVWSRDTRKQLGSIVIAGVVLASLITALGVFPGNTLPEILVVKGSFFEAVLMTELITGMAVLSVTAGLPWKRHAPRVAYALGVYSLVEVVIEAGHNLFGKFYASAVDVKLANIRAFFYVCCLVYWSYTFWKDEPLRGTVDADPLQAVLRWRKELPEELFRR